ncbi:hypothetical protein ABZY31_27920 [Streptomyces sp. NPDC006529]|uniref:DUF6891 domain-containing protein n=1 Tax=Streptomyces sp. NPDC006529 TaxID=3157177 RepID=UPI0033B5A95C
MTGTRAGTDTGTDTAPTAPGSSASASALAIRIGTESGEAHVRPAPFTLERLAERIGAEGDRFLVVERLPSDPDVYIQVWHDVADVGAQGYQLEHRDGAPDRHFRAFLRSASEVGEVMAAWARGDEGWDRGPAWERVAFRTEEAPPLDPAVRAQVEERVRLALRCGYAGRAELAELAEDYLVSGEVRPVSAAQAHELAVRLWRERLAEQAEWTGETDPERLSRAFAALEAGGITARENFACCRGCALAEIRGDGAEDARGFVFFHRQCTEGAAEGGDLFLYYGAYPEAADGETAEGPEADGAAVADEAVGREVTAALDGVGLRWQWDGSAHDAIRVTGLDWRKRLAH